MDQLFPIIKVPDDADQSNEDMGTKYKFWYHDAALGRCLFKQARPNTGEDWAEKLAAEFAKLIGIPHVNYELATFKGQAGIVSQSMLPKNAILQHGNEILASLASSYPATATYNVRQHTIDLVMQAIDLPTVLPPYNWSLPLHINTAIDTFIGYLLFDTWISNSDRHHENWGFIILENAFYLAPTYDHGSSLGRELLDTKRQSIFANGSVATYIQKSRSAMYRTVNDPKTLLNLEVFQIVAARHPQSAKVWLQKLADISTDDITKLLLRVPESRFSPITSQFTYQILTQNRNRLLNLRASLS